MKSVPRTLKQRVYGHLRAKLINGELQGGDAVSESRVANEIGVSRTPVREAIQQLESEGLLTPLAKSGTIVRRPDRQDIVELFQLREALETAAVEIAASRMTDDELNQMAKLLGEMDLTASLLDDPTQGAQIAKLYAAYSALDAAFHMVMLRAAGNRRILKVVADCRIMTQLLGFPKLLPEKLAKAFREAAREHRGILDALRQHDPTESRRLLSEHLRVGCELVLAALQEADPVRLEEHPVLSEWPSQLRDILRGIESDPK